MWYHSTKKEPLHHFLVWRDPPVLQLVLFNNVPPSPFKSQLRPLFLPKALLLHEVLQAVRWEDHHRVVLVELAELLKVNETVRVCIECFQRLGEISREEGCVFVHCLDKKPILLLVDRARSILVELVEADYERNGRGWQAI